MKYPARKIIFGKMTVYQTFCMLLIVVFLVDHYFAGGI